MGESSPSAVGADNLCKSALEHDHVGELTQTYTNSIEVVLETIHQRRCVLIPVLLLVNAGLLLLFVVLGGRIMRQHPEQRRHRALILVAYGEVLPLVSTIAILIARPRSRPDVDFLLVVSIAGALLVIWALARLHAVGYPHLAFIAFFWGFSLVSASIGSLMAAAGAPAEWNLYAGAIGLIGLIVLASSLALGARVFAGAHRRQVR